MRDDARAQVAAEIEYSEVNREKAALFSEAERRLVDGYFKYDRLSRESNSNASTIRGIIRAFNDQYNRCRIL